MHPFDIGTIYIPTYIYRDDFKDYIDNILDEEEEESLRESLCSVYDLLLFSDDGIEWSPFDEDEFEYYLENAFNGEFYLAFLNKSLIICINKQVIAEIMSYMRKSMSGLSLVDFSKTALASIRNFINGIIPFEKYVIYSLWESTLDGESLSILQNENMMYVINRKIDEFYNFIKKNRNKKDLIELMRVAQYFSLDMSSTGQILLHLNTYPEIKLWKMEPVFLGGTLTLLSLNNAIERFLNRSLSEDCQVYISILEEKLSEGNEDLEAKLSIAYKIIELFISDLLQQ